MASSYFICCANLETKLSEHFKVPHSIYVYVKQLECQINQHNSDSFKSYDDLDKYDRGCDDTASKISGEILSSFS